MRDRAAAPFQKWSRYVLMGIALTLFLFEAIICIFLLDKHLKTSAQHLPLIQLTLFSFSCPLVIAWGAFGVMGSTILFGASSMLTFLAAWADGNAGFLLYALYQILLVVLLIHFERRKNFERISHEIEMEKIISERNDLELAYKEKGTNISVSFEKFTSYYNLRKLANDFSTTLSLPELGQMVVTKTMELVGRGDSCFLFLADPDTAGLSLISSKTLKGERKAKAKGGDLYDLWILRNRQSLNMSDAQKDFRFDMRKAAEVEDVRSAIGAPLVHEGKVVGTLRLNSQQPGVFFTEDLRLLDAISTLASAAISNAILYRKTEDLAIRDSLTGLYVRRYFLDRLAEEHRRSLLTNAPLTLLMCDLDHFKTANDRYGHGVGDFILMKTSELLVREAKHGIVSRYGGEEFSILLPQFDLTDGRAVGEAIRKAVAAMNLTVRREIIPVTISIGVANIPKDTLDSEELIRIADNRLYSAKKAGRNRTC